MNMKIPDAVVHGLVSRLENRIPDGSYQKLKEVLSQEHDMSQTITFIVHGYRELDFHVMIRRVEVKLPEMPCPHMRWQVVTLVVTNQLGFIYDEPVLNLKVDGQVIGNS